MMGLLLDLLKATAAGQSDTLGRWRRAVSQALDSLQAQTIVLQEVSAAPVVIVAAGSADVFAGLAFTTTVPNQQVLLLFSASRDNADPGGSGLYSFKIDGVTSLSRSVAGDVTSIVNNQFLATVAVAGPHIANVETAAAVGNETVSDGATLIIQGSG